MPSWLAEYSITWAAVGWGFVLFLVSFTASILMVGFVFARLPATYFSDTHTSAFLSDTHPTLRLAARIGKNVLGVGLILLGIVLSLPGVPGQGILTILVGILLVDFPGKRKLECRLVRRPKVLQTINQFRARFGKPPLIVDNCGEPAADGLPRQEQPAETVAVSEDRHSS